MKATGSAPNLTPAFFEVIRFDWIKLAPCVIRLRQERQGRDRAFVML